MKSPKGNLRQWQWAIVAVIGLGAVLFVNGQEWFTYTINAVSKLSIGLIALYYAGRTFLHDRTHELSQTSKETRQNYLIIAISIIVGCSLL